MFKSRFYSDYNDFKSLSRNNVNILDEILKNHLMRTNKKIGNETLFRLYFDGLNIGSYINDNKRPFFWKII